MPVPVAAKVGIIAASVAVAAAIAIYESPEVRRAAQQLRRRIAIALQSLGEDVDPGRPRFNRPEDAQGFYESHEVDADEETRRRQREELMYWNMRHLEEQRQREMQESQQQPRGATFDDFLQPDRTGGSGAYVYNSGAKAWDTDLSNVLRRRGNGEGMRGLNAAILSNPFSDEHGIELDDRADILPQPRDPRMSQSDIYNATPRAQSPVQVLDQSPPVTVPVASQVLFDFESHTPSTIAQSEYASAVDGDDQSRLQAQHDAASISTRSSTTLDRELGPDEYVTAGQDYSSYQDAYASIQAWAQNSSHHGHSRNNDHGNNGFYSPLPSTPAAPISEPEIISEGQLTPTDTTDSMSVAESGIEVAREVTGYGNTEAAREFDVMSETTDGSGEGMNTPGSWSEVGSVVSEEDGAVHA
ncbi:hypothetical protein VTI74DRAFT_8173 [Chaetomium olivicolor]